MFCLMDVSGSMTEAMKDLAKRFFMLLHVFLTRRYRHVDVVFIRHTAPPRKSTRRRSSTAARPAARVVSTALEKMKRISPTGIRPTTGTSTARRPRTATTSSDNAKSAASAAATCLPLCQYFAYVEVGQDYDGDWRLAGRDRSVARPICGAPTSGGAGQRTSRCGGSAIRREIFPVFRELFCEKARRAVPETRCSEERQRNGRCPGNARRRNQLIYAGADWDYGTMQRVYDAIERIAFDELGLDIYPVQIEVITSEQMLDAYASVGMPLMYRHWSFGKRFAYHETLYRKGLQGLAYEIVINSNPCICYIMEENSMTMQTLVMAHAAFGHNHFFKNNYLFRQWTDAGGILDYLAFAKTYHRANARKATAIRRSSACSTRRMR